MLSRLGTFLLGEENSLLRISEPPIMTPQLAVLPRPVVVRFSPGEATTVATVVVLEPQLGFSGSVTLSAAARVGIEGVSFNPATASSGEVATTVRVSSGAPPGLYAVAISATPSAGAAFTGDLLVTVSPAAFFAINGVVIPVIQEGFSETREPIGDSARGRDGTLTTTVSGYKRTWKFKTEPLLVARYSALAAYLFRIEGVDSRRVLVGDVVPGEAVRVVMTPEQPDIFKANGELYYQLAGQAEEV